MRDLGPEALAVSLLGKGRQHPEERSGLGLGRHKRAARITRTTKWIGMMDTTAATEPRHR